MIVYSKQAGSVANVGMFIVKLVPADFTAKSGAVAKLNAVLHVTRSFAPSAAEGVIAILLFAVTAVDFTIHVAAEESVAQETAPDAAEPHDTTDGLAAVPLAAQSLLVPSLVTVIFPILSMVA